MKMKKTEKISKAKISKAKNVVEIPEQTMWESGFKCFTRRIREQLQMNDIADNMVEDEDLLPYYRMGESETYVLSALGCAVGM